MTLVRPAIAPARLVVRGARVLDPREGIDGAFDLVVLDGRLVELAPAGSAEVPEGAEVIDGEGRHVLPAFVDPHVHLRVPGQEHKEDLETGTRAAAAGGFCAVVAMPNTEPVVDSAPILRALRDAAVRDARVPVAFTASITKGLRGEELTEMAELRDEGAIAFTDDGKPIVSAGMMRKALQYQRLAGGLLALHEEDPALSGRGAMHEGEVSALLGHRRHPERERVDHGRPRLRAGRLRRRSHPHPAPVVHRVGRGGRGGQGRPACTSPARPRRTTCASPRRRSAAWTRG